MSNQDITVNAENSVAHQASVAKLKSLTLPVNAHHIGEMTCWQVALRDYSTGKILSVVKAPQVHGQSGFNFVIHEKAKTEKQANWILASGVYRTLVLPLKSEDFGKTLRELFPSLKGGKPIAVYSFQVAIADGNTPHNIPAGQAYVIWDAGDRFEIPSHIHRNTVAYLRELLTSQGISVSERRGFPKGRVGAAVVDLDEIKLEPETDDNFDASVGNM